MDNILRILYDEHKAKKIVPACNALIIEMQRHQSNWTAAHSEVFANCLFKVFLSNKKNIEVLSSIIETLIEFLSHCSDAKLKLTEKGIFSNINELLQNNSCTSAEQGRAHYIKCIYNLTIALTEQCPQAQKTFFEIGTINFIIESLQIFNRDVDIIALCFHQLSIIFLHDEPDDFFGSAILKLKHLCCQQVFEYKINLEPFSVNLLFVLNQYPNECDKLQLYGLKCLRSFAFLEGGADQIVSFGGLESICHALFAHGENHPILNESFLLIKVVLLNVDFCNFASKCNDLCEALSQAFHVSIKSPKLLSEITDVLMTLLVVGSNLSSCFVKNGLHRLIFQSVNSMYNYCPSHLENVFLKATQCLFLLISNPNDDIIDDILLDACENGDVDLVLLVLALGANINGNSNETGQPLLIACANEDETLVKQVIILMSTFQHFGVKKSRIDRLHPALLLTLQKMNRKIVAALLWYLLNRDLDGTAEWSGCNLERLKTEWLEIAFASPTHECNNNQEADGSEINVISLCQAKWYQLGKTILESYNDHNESQSHDQETSEIIQRKFNRFRSDDKHQKCPLQHIQSLIDNDKELLKVTRFVSCTSIDGESEFLSEYRCPRCSGHGSFREFLKLSFDTETLLEERIHKNPVDMCTCSIAFPPTQFSTTPVKEIQLSRNGLLSLDSFINLSKETKMRLSQSVTRITLFDNKLTELPAAFAQIFTSLIKINLSRNQLLQFPFEIFLYCPNLEDLDLSENLIQESLVFPFNTLKGQVQATNNSRSRFQHGLKVLKLSSNAITEFPIWILEILPTLKCLEMRKNLLKSIVDQESLSAVAARSKDFLTNLEYVDFSQNSINTVEVSLLRYARSLRKIDFSQNYISEMKMDAESCLVDCKLFFVNLSQNQLSEIPRFLYFLPKLKTLILASNNISTIPIVTASWKSKRLTHLDLSSNEITDIYLLASILTQYWPSSLKELRLANNAITELPSSLGELQALETLDISDNKLEVLPNELGLLSNLKSFLLRNNKFSLEETILNGAAENIRQFLYARLKNSVPQNRLKLILVGNPEAGKTTLLNSLMNLKRTRTFSSSIVEAITGVELRQHSNLATVGVNVVEINLTKGNRTYQLSVWDFAGQEEFYATHPCFISERAMYIAMYDASKGVEQLQTLKPWLTAIHARAGNCPVLIIGSHADLLQRGKKSSILLKSNLQMMSLQDWFPRGAISNNSPRHELFDVRKYSNNIPTLRNLIVEIISNAKVQEHQLVGNMVPSSYLQLSNILLREAQKKSEFPVISFNELVMLLQGQADSHCSWFESSSELMSAIKYLHQTGVLLHFDDPRSRLQDYFFIKPDWLCKLFAQVVTIKEDVRYKISPYIDSKGILSKSRFTQNIISEQSLPSSFIPRFLRLLENFEVILWQGDDSYLVPCRLPNEKPDIELPIQESRNKLIRIFSMIYTPMGLWPRLLARLLAFANNLLHGYLGKVCQPFKTKTWTEGVYFEWHKTKSNSNPFVLVQSGSEVFDHVCNLNGNDLCSSDNDTDGELDTSSFLDKRSFLEVVVPRSQEGLTLLAQMADHVTTLFEEWYPGLLKLDNRGKSLFQQYSPCFICYDCSRSVHCFCIDELADSVLRRNNSAHDKVRYKVKSASSGTLLIYCPNHLDTPIPLMFIAPEINLDDFDPSLRLDPNLLSFDGSARFLLGNGSFGNVYHCTYNNEDVAIKTFSHTSDFLYKMLRAELNVLAQHQHPSIIPLKGFIPPAISNLDLPLPLLAIEYARLGSLGKLLSNMAKMPAQTRKSALSPFIRHRIAYEVADGLCFLHRQNIVYRDLKPDNILLSSLSPSDPTIAKITDYGISTLASPSGIPGASGTPGYKAPEVVSLKGSGLHHGRFPYSKQCDIYSYGLVLHELAVGRSPWVDYVYEEHCTEKDSTIKPARLDDIVRMGIVPLPISSYKGASSWPFAQQLIRKCLERNPEERPTSCQIVSLLSDAQSCCLRSVIPLLSSDPIFARSYRNTQRVNPSFVRCISCAESSDEISLSTNQNTEAHLYHSSQPCLNQEADDATCSIMRIVIDFQKGSVISDDVFLQLEAKMTVTCLIKIPIFLAKAQFTEKKQTPTRSFSTRFFPDSDPVLVAGTSQGHVVVIRSSSYMIKEKYNHEVTSLHYHQRYESKTIGDNNAYVIVALKDLSLLVYSVEQIFDDYNRKPPHQINLNLVAIEAVRSMESIGNTVYVISGKKIILIGFSDKDQPTINSLVETKESIEHFVTGPSHFYTNMHESDTVLVYRCGKILPIKAMKTADVLMQRIENFSSNSPAVVSSLFVDGFYSSLWVGMNTGHLILYSESRYEVLAVVQRYSGPIMHIFALEDSFSNCETIACLGLKIRSLFADMEEARDETLTNPSESRRLRSTSIDDTYYLTVWSADLVNQTPLFASILKARECLMRKSR